MENGKIKKMIEQYHIFENLQQAKKYLKDNNIPETDPKYVNLKELFRNNLGYLGQFTKWMYDDRENFDKIKDVYDKLKSINNLDRQINSFEKMEDLYDYLIEFELNRKAMQIINSLPSISRENVTPELINLLSANLEYSDILKKYYREVGGRFNSDRRRASRVEKPPEFKTYSDWLYHDTKTYIKNLKGGFSPDVIRKKCEGVNATVIVDKPNVMLVQVDDFEASRKIGTQSWCICQSENMWNSYVNDFTVQYFIYDFTKDQGDPKHLIGATVSYGGKITTAQFSNNRSVGDLTYFDTL
jgi:hypothetical protein